MSWSLDTYYVNTCVTKNISDFLETIFKNLKLKETTKKHIVSNKKSL